MTTDGQSTTLLETTLHSITTESIDDCTPTDSCSGHYYCSNATNQKVCLSGWSGEDCTDRDIGGRVRDTECPAAAQYTGCRNGGTCWAQTCCCVNGFEGNLCQDEIIECESNPCGAGGTCVELVGGYWCECPSGKS